LSLLEGPGVDKVAVADQVQPAGFVEVPRGPLVHALQPRHDHRVVEHPAKTVLVSDVALDFERERIAVRHHRDGTFLRPPDGARPDTAGERLEEIFHLD
jgi:hypothetical protein